MTAATLPSANQVLMEGLRTGWAKEGVSMTAVSVGNAHHPTSSPVQFN